MGVCAFSSNFFGSGEFRQIGVISSRPPAGNAHRSAKKYIDNSMNELYKLLYGNSI
jgi:hypothetical protein